MKRAWRTVAAGAALTAVASLGPSAPSTEAVPAHHPAPIGASAFPEPKGPYPSPEAATQERNLTPDQARAAMIGGLSCNLGEVTKVSKPWVDSANGMSLVSVDLVIDTNQTPASLAAQRQYNISSAVEWEFATGTAVLEEATFANKGLGMVLTGDQFGKKHNSEVLVPADAVTDGNVFEVYDSMSVVVKSDGAGSSTWEKDVQVPCGLIAETDGQWSTSNKITPLPGHTASHTEQQFNALAGRGQWITDQLYIPS